ncbi:MAG: HAMP domain-containing histidine kinase [Cyclobacteriaceae bacterium]|nr:HAMP domain-containing histidine kinase [Cyclobacteriaceae bacterium]
MPTRRIRKLILGEHPFIPSRSQYKRVVLTSQLSILTFFICIIFFTIDILSHPNLYSLIIQFVCAVAAATSLVLNRKGKHTAAKIILVLVVNITLFIFSESEPLPIGLYLFFIVVNVGTIAAFGFEEKKLAILFISFSFFLFTLSLFTDITNIPKIGGTNEYIQYNVFLNFTISFISSTVIIYFLINLNHRSESALLENEQQMSAKNEELTKVNAELDKFMYSTSHDLRSPISSVLGLIQLTKMTNDPKETKTYLEMMEERLASLNKFIKDISDYSRNARTDVNHEPIPVQKAINDIIDHLKFYPGAEKISVAVIIDSNLVMHTDATRFQIIFSNLISNSFKYVDQHKKNCFIRISAQQTYTEIKFRLEDNGLGISEKYLPRIFDMFFQAHEKSEGSGLGLYIVKEAVIKLNGTITAKSKIEIGSVFELSFPLSKT